MQLTMLLSITPGGNAVVKGGESELRLTAAIKTNMAADVRRKIPGFQDRPPELYCP